MDPKAVSKRLSVDKGIGDWMPSDPQSLIQAFEQLGDFDAGNVERMLLDFLSGRQLKAGVLINAVRTALTGQTVGPEFIDVLVCLGRQRVVARLKKALPVVIDAADDDG